MNKIRIVVVDDHPLFRQGVVNTLAEDAGITVVGEADTAAGGLEKIRDTLPEVVLLDLRLPDGSGLDIVKTLQAEVPFSKVIVLTAVEDEEVLLQALKVGARGYLLKGVSGGELLRVVRAVAAGDTYVSPQMAGRLLKEMMAPGERPAPLGFGDLTERERTILSLLADGLTNKEIAGRIFLSEKTVKHYMTNILQKLQVRNRLEAALLATRARSGL